MRNNSGKGDSNINLKDPTPKQQEEQRNKSGEAEIKEGAHGDDQEPASSHQAGRTRSPEMGPIDRH
ncbi:MAG TPA: hypothetical protein VNA29_04825 [Sphingomicrobium sp.]|nr:hypothetical protein [Sphingomicrobium sp.]